MFILAQEILINIKVTVCVLWTLFYIYKITYGTLVMRKNQVEVAELLVDHDTKDAHLGGASVVQLDGALLHLRRVAQLAPSEVQGTIAEVSHEFGGAVTEGVLVHPPGSLVLILVGGLHHCPRGDHLRPDHAREVVEGGESRRDVPGSRKAHAGVRDEVSGDGEHGDAAVLELDPAEAVEVLLVAIGDAPEGIEEAEGGLGAELLR